MARAVLTHGEQTVVLAHPNRLIRESIAVLLGQAGYRVVGQAEDESGLRRLVVQHKPDIVLLDWDISEGRVDTVHRVSTDVPGAIVVVLTRPQPAESFVEAMREGARGYLSANLSPDEFLQSLRMLTRGDIIISKDMAGEVKKALRTVEPSKPATSLSVREREVLTLVGEGATNREIAQKLFVSEHTIKVHLRGILSKLSLRNRQQAAVFAEREGLLKDTNPEGDSPQTSP
jgi:DNA-binding NarL/FixJ family response regulator